MLGRDIKIDLEGNSVLENGDFALEEDIDKAFANRILRASKGAWKFDPELGIGLQDYIGNSNTPENAQKIEEVVIDGMRKAGLQADCSVYPTSFDSVAIRITVYTPEGPKNVSFAFRYEDGKVSYIDTEQQQEGIFETRKSVNKYDKRRT